MAYLSSVAVAAAAAAAAAATAAAAAAAAAAVAAAATAAAAAATISKLNGAGMAAVKWFSELTSQKSFCHMADAAGQGQSPSKSVGLLVDYIIFKQKTLGT